MERVKSFANRAFVKPIWLTVLISVPSFVFLTLVLVKHLGGTILGPASYALSTYALILSGTAVYRIVRKIQTLITTHRLWKRYRSDVVFKTKISLLPSTVINFVFIFIKILFGILYQSIWMIALGIYYICLFLLRVSLVKSVYRRSIAIQIEEETRATRLYGCFLLLLDVALGGIVLYSLRRGAEYSYPGYLIYAMAAYTFYAVIMATIGFVKHRRQVSPVLRTVNILKLTTALVALFALETAMLATFGGDSSIRFRQCMIAVTGFGVVLIIFGLAVYLIRYRSNVSEKKGVPSS